MEFSLGRGAVRVYHVDADGELLAAAIRDSAEVPLRLEAAQQR